MADRNKAQRLKYAKKMVLEHKLKAKKGDDVTPEGSVLLNVHSLTSSVHSTDSAPDNDSTNKAPLTNYFSPVIDPSTFFDTLPMNGASNQGELHNSANLFTHFGTGDQTTELPSSFYAFPGEDHDPGAIEDPEINPNEIYDRLHSNEKVPNDPICDVLPAETPNEEYRQPSINNDSESEPIPCNVMYSNTESLRQLSSQMTNLIDSNVDFDFPKHTHDLEVRNQELASLLEQEKVKSEQYHAELNKYQRWVAKLEEESQQERQEFDQKLSIQMGPLQEQLQTHMQTVGILVGEKSELSASLSQCQVMLKQRNAESDELQARLKTSRSRVADLEKELNNLRMEKSNYDKIESEHSGVHSELTKSCKLLKEQKEEALQDLSELREKFSSSASDNLKLQHEIQELNAQLSLANIKIQQLSAGEAVQNDLQLESAVQQKMSLEKQVTELNQALKTISSERDQASHQYQQYVQQLNGQLTLLAQKLDTTVQENETLAKREQNLVKHIGELERHLQNLQNEHFNFSSNNTKKELDASLEYLQNAQMEKQKLEESFNGVRNERDELLKELIVKKSVIEELEGSIERMQGNQPDNAKLLAVMESDKVAAARAVTQNNQLKEQLEEMQSAFIKMSNDKLELTEQLTAEQFQNKELTEKLFVTDNQLHKLADAIEIKDRELIAIRDSSGDLNKHVLQQNQLTDRLHHYEALEISYHTLQRELEESRMHIEALENGKLPEFPAENELELNTNPKRQDEMIANNNHVNQHYVSVINKEMAMQQLEEKFRKTMDNIANLQDEKQSLEHLVLQLQGETETIGEYITLYQHQRAVLRQRTVEKEEQMKRLAADREEMRKKLEKLNALIQRLMLEKSSIPEDILRQKEQLCDEHAKLHQEMNHTATDVAAQPQRVNGLHESEPSSRDTAEKIIALLSEIKTSNLVQSGVPDNFHPCPWCSGQLITV